MDSNINVFFDLEETLVESIDNIVFNGNTDFASWVAWAKSKAQAIHLFSFALWDESDLNRYENKIKEVEKHYDIKFDRIILKNELIEIYKKYKKIQEIDSYDFSILVGKEEALKIYAMNNHLFNSYLFDDTVNVSKQTYYENIITKEVERYNFTFINVKFS